MGAVDGQARAIECEALRGDANVPARRQPGALVGLREEEERCSGKLEAEQRREVAPEAGRDECECGVKDLKLAKQIRLRSVSSCYAACAVLAPLYVELGSARSTNRKQPTGSQPKSPVCDVCTFAVTPK